MTRKQVKKGDKPFDLTEEQQTLCNRIVNSLCDRATILMPDETVEDLRLSTRPPPYPPRHFKIPRKSNVFALFANRGYGKTTLLLEILERLQGEAYQDRFVVVDRPIDCSLCPPGATLSLMVVHRIHRHLDRLRRRAAGGRANLPPSPDEAYRELIQTLQRGIRRYRDVMANVSVSARQYGRFAVEDMAEQLSLPRRVSDWLYEELHTARQGSSSPVRQVVLALDDVDLARRDFACSILPALLDELHQPQLLLLLAAHERRLEAAVEPGVYPSDRNTVQALFYKVLTQPHRFRIQEFPASARLSFRVKEPTESIERLLESTGVAKAFAYGNLRFLLPHYPRGLENLRRYLVELSERKDGGGKGAIRPPPTFLADLAEMRGEFDLAARLREQPPERIVRSFAWPADVLASGQWPDLVSGVRNSEVLWAIQPEVVSAGPEKLRTHLVEHEESSVAWAEVLLDEALKSRRLSPLGLVQRIPALHHRWSGLGMRVDFEQDELSEWSSDLPAGRPADLCWMAWGRGAESIQCHTGLPALLEVLAGMRSPWPNLPSFLAPAGAESMLVTVRQRYLLHGVPKKRKKDAQEPPPPSPSLLPTTTRSLILLVDALVEAPWEEISRLPGTRGPATFARIAAALTALAYIRAAYGPDHGLDAYPFGILWRSPANITRFDDESTNEEFARLLAFTAWPDFKPKELTDQDGPDFKPKEPTDHEFYAPLHDAFQALLAHPVFRDLHDPGPADD